MDRREFVSALAGALLLTHSNALSSAVAAPSSDPAPLPEITQDGNRLIIPIQYFVEQQDMLVHNRIFEHIGNDFTKLQVHGQLECVRVIGKSLKRVMTRDLSNPDIQEYGVRLRWYPWEQQGDSGYALEMWWADTEGATDASCLIISNSSSVHDICYNWESANEQADSGVFEQPSGRPSSGPRFVS